MGAYSHLGDSDSKRLLTLDEQTNSNFWCAWRESGDGGGGESRMFGSVLQQLLKHPSDFRLRVMPGSVNGESGRRIRISEHSDFCHNCIITNHIGYTSALKKKIIALLHYPRMI
jgi:hypothetical protein